METDQETDTNGGEETSAEEDRRPSPSQAMIEPTDDELREKLRKAREIAAARGGMAPFVPEPPRGIQTHRLPDGIATWEPPCTNCHEPIGYLAPDGKYVVVTECAKCRAGSIAARLAASGISHREISAELNALKPHGPDGKLYSEDWPRWMTYLRNFGGLTPRVAIEPPFAFACGNNGVGKSAGGQRALRDAIMNGCQGRYLRLSELLSAIYATYGTDEKTEDRIAFYSTIHLLVIDEVGQEDATDHAMGLFFGLVDSRWANKKPTIFLSNYLPQPDSLGAHMMSRTDDPTRMKGLLDRICGGARSNLFIIRGSSWRGREE